LPTNPLVNCLPNHLAHKLKKVKMVVCQVTEWGRVKSFFRCCAKKVETWVKHFLDGLLQKFFEDTILIDAGLVKSLHVDKADPDQSLKGGWRK